MESKKDDKLNKDTAKDQLALLEKQEEIREKRKKEEKERSDIIAQINKTANAVQQRNLAALIANNAKTGETAKAEKILASLPPIPLIWNDENKERPLVCGLLFVDFSSGKMQYSAHKPIEISAKIKPVRMLAILMMKQPNTVTYDELAKAFELLTPRMEYTTVSAHQRFGRQIQDILTDLKDILRKSGMTNNEIKNMIRAKPKHGIALRC